jgi:hypothetical protein
MGPDRWLRTVRAEVVRVDDLGDAPGLDVIVEEEEVHRAPPISRSGGSAVLFDADWRPSSKDGRTNN